MSTPQIRFKEFGGEWKKQQLLDVAPLQRGFDLPVDNIKDGLFPVVFSNGILKYHNEFKVKAPGVVTGRSGTIGRVTFVEEDFWPHNTSLWVTDFKNNYPRYIYYFYSQYKLDRFGTGSGVPTLNRNDIHAQVEFFPTLLEQQKIADFLTSVDEKINLLKKKKELLEQYKKGVMQKIFSQELRFKDEEGKDFPEWEEKELGKIGTFQTSSVDKLSRVDEDNVYLINYMNVYRHEEINNKTIQQFQIVTAKKAQIESCNLKRGDILFTPSSETPDDIGHSVVIYEDLNNAVFSYHLMRFRPSISLDIGYSHYFCNIPHVLKQLSKLATGSTRFTISVKSFSSVKVYIPQVKEQQKIADFLTALDDKIALVEQQINKTELWKKGLLQQMFV